jgi:iron complex transport system permease protein
MKLSKIKIMKAAILILILLIVILAGLCLGVHFISPKILLESLIADDGLYHTLIYNIRIPRIAVALLVGSWLSVGGAAFQKKKKNPLADPYILGVSSGAALGASIAISFELTYGFVMLFAAGGAFVSIFIVYLISSKIEFGSAGLILAGIALAFIFSSGVMLVNVFANTQNIHKAIMWLMGDLSLSRFEIILPCMFIGFIVMIFIWLKANLLDVIALGDDFSTGLGVVNRDKRIMFVLASILVAMSVAIAGVIAFVGLIVPHICRQIFGVRHISLIPYSALCGAVFLALADTIGRSVLPPYEIPCGIITSFAGGIFFLVLLFGLRRIYK